MSSDQDRPELITGPMPSSMAPPAGTKALLFDCDGTLVDTMALYKNSWKVVFAARGFELTEEWFESMRGHSLDPFIRAAFPGIDESELRQIEAEGLQLFFSRIHELETFEHVVEVAREYRGKIPLAVVSGGPRSAVEATLNGSGLTELFDVILTGSDVVHGKPAPDVYLKAMEILGVQPHECVVYEDSPTGIAAARSAGINHVVDITLHG